MTDHGEAVRVLYEIDSRDSDKNKCFLIISQVFQKIDRMAMVLKEQQKLLKTAEASATEGWIIFAKRNRQKKIALLKLKLKDGKPN